MAYFVKGLTKRQIKTFEQIALGSDKGVNRRTAEALLRKGLINEKLTSYGMHLAVYRYSVPLPIHVKWCEWCANQFND